MKIGSRIRGHWHRSHMLQKGSMCWMLKSSGGQHCTRIRYRYCNLKSSSLMLRLMTPKSSLLSGLLCSQVVKSAR